MQLSLSTNSRDTQEITVSNDFSITDIHITKLINDFENIVVKVNNNLDYKLKSKDFELLLGIQEAGNSSLTYINPLGASEDIPDYHVIGSGEQYGSFLLKKLWRSNMKMIDGAELGYKIIKYIEKFELDESVGIGREKAQIIFIPSKNEIKEGSEKLLTKLEELSSEWLLQYEDFIVNQYASISSQNEYVAVNSWGSMGVEDGQFYYPEGIAISSLGQIYVAAEHNHCVQVFDEEGNFLFKWGTKGTEAGSFQYSLFNSVRR